MSGNAEASGNRFRDRRERKYGYDFLDEVLVRCPRCDGCAPVTPHFQRPVWLQASCRGNVLWAYNLRHLDLLETYVQAKLRERGELVPWAPMSLVERLPTWLKTAKNRTEILRTIKCLRSTVPAAG